MSHYAPIRIDLCETALRDDDSNTVCIPATRLNTQIPGRATPSPPNHRRSLPLLSNLSASDLRHSEAVMREFCASPLITERPTRHDARTTYPGTIN